MVFNYVLAAWKMPQRNPMTRFLLRAPKLKEAEIGEDSSPSTARQLEYSPRVDTTIKTSMKKDFIQPLVFDDIEETTRSKIILPQWGDIFNRIKSEDYPKFIPHSNSDVRVLEDQVFLNI